MNRGDGIKDPGHMIRNTQGGVDMTGMAIALGKSCTTESEPRSFRSFN